VHFFDQPKNQLWGFIKIEKSRCQKSGVIHSTKNNETRQVPILAPAAEILLALPRRKGFVFGGSDPLPVGQQKHFARTLQRIAIKAGLEPITFHQLRHSFCSLLDTMGVPRRIVSEIMGHRDLATTNRYSHMKDASVLNYFANYAGFESYEDRLLEVIYISATVAGA